MVPYSHILTLCVVLCDVLAPARVFAVPLENHPVFLECLEQADGSCTKLELWDEDLSGTLPSKLGLLTRLGYISMGFNSLTGTVPTELGLLTGLYSMSLAYNALRGTLPSELGLLTRLVGMWFRNNSLSGTLPTELGLLSALRSLRLESNELEGSVPSELGRPLRTLEFFVCENERICGDLPPGVRVASHEGTCGMLGTRLGQECAEAAHSSPPPDIEGPSSSSGVASSTIDQRMVWCCWIVMLAAMQMN
eukprot:CAMPEP_0114229812 /NCGR_PEP_ID=MMETSP0058-20121206/3118_1 /TAXON_ID=36894 /ORGANISM="Pyramimonas parkeae, CCMP726" /LENGTH=249 /DNA_ID=CAMNT_0001340935 /DNA_START=164 /DNA_END=916 /DNA_ORIENTATION=-